MNYYNLKEIPVPEGSKPDGSRVYVMRDIGGGKRMKLYIGTYAKKFEGTFYPNDNFRLYFPSLWEEHYGNTQLSPHFLQLGVHLLALLISHRLGLYPILHEVFGPLHGNAMLDFAVYSIKERRNAAYLFRPAMSDSVLFSKDRFDDDFLSRLFNEETDPGKIREFRLAWLSACRERGIDSVYLTVDGTNFNCETDSPLAQKGEAKSKKNIRIVSHIWAVSAKDGLPVTWFVNEGSTVDAKAMAEITAYLSGNGISVKGIILDRGFLSHDILDGIAALGTDYVVKLKSDTRAHLNMVDSFGGKIYWNINYLIGEGALFGITKGPYRIFSDHDTTAYVALYFDGRNGSERKAALYDKIFQARQAAEAKALAGEKPVVSREMGPYLKVAELPSRSGEGKRYIVLPKKEGSGTVFRKGFDSIAFSREMPASEANAVYHLRDASEKQFMVCKTMLGSSVFRAHETRGRPGSTSPDLSRRLTRSFSSSR